MALSDAIERFIHEMLEEGGATQIELQRNELANYFQCAPSQINYVLSTRFSLDRGYIIESKKGGGGCIRVIRVTTDTGGELLELINQRIGDEVSFKRATALALSLEQSGVLTHRETLLLLSAVSDRAIALPVSAKDRMRAAILKSMLLAIIQWDK